MYNITFITNSIGFGGASKMLCFVAEKLAERGHNVTIINRNGTDADKENERAVPPMVKYYSISENSRISEIKKIASIAKDENANVLISFTGMPNILARLVSWLLHIPSIISERGDPYRTFNLKNPKSRLSLSIINTSKGAVFQTDGAGKFYSKGLQKRGQVIPNPIFITDEIPEIIPEEREKSIVSVSRLENYQKRFDVMLNAFKLFSDSHPEYILKLYGKGPDEDKIKTWAKELGISDKVKFMGLTSSPMQDTAKDGIYIITSDYEGIPNSLLEAMAIGLPCVATDCTPGGARLLIQDHENGLLVPVGDAEKIADALCEFADNSELAKKCGENAKDVINRFSPAKIIDMWENYINTILK